MALLLPLTFGMPPVTAIVMLAGIMYGGMYGGTLTSVLVNVPGEAVERDDRGRRPSDRAPGPRRRGAQHFRHRLVSRRHRQPSPPSLFITPLLSDFALRFNAPEYFLLATLGITASASLGGASAVKALMAAVLGLMVALVGVDPIIGRPAPDLRPGRAGRRHRLPARRDRHLRHRRGAGLARADCDELQPIRTRLRDMWLTAEEWAESRMAILRGGARRLPRRHHARRRPDDRLDDRLCHREALQPPSRALRQGRARRRRRRRIRQQLGGPRRTACRCSRSAFPGSASTAVLLAALILQGIRPGPDADDRAARAGLGPDRQHVHRQRHAARHQPAAGAALRLDPAHSLCLSRAGHPGDLAGRRLCHHAQLLHGRRSASCSASSAGS